MSTVLVVAHRSVEMNGVTALVESMCADAVAAAGLDDFGDDWFLGPLTAWAEDLQRPHLNDFGRRFLRGQAVKELVRRLRVFDVLRHHPEIADVPVPPILYITGLARSGTTLLHNLLALHPRARALRRWELVDPVPPPEAATYERDPRIDAVQATVDRLRGTPLERMHWVNADDPEECVWGFLDATSMLGQAASFWMPAWREALYERDQTPTFANYRRLLQLLLWKHPVPDGGFVVLKAPQISRRIEEFAATFPEARFVITHRDPFRCIVSTTVLCEGLAAPFVHDNPLRDDGRRGRLVQRACCLQLGSIAAFDAAHPHRATHVAYPDLVGDPTGTARTALAAAPEGAPFDIGSAVRAFLDAQRAGTRAAPPDRLETMGYDQEELWADTAVAAYAEQFDVVPERDRLTGMSATIG